MGWGASLRAGGEGGDEDVEGAQAAAEELARKGLDANSEEGGEGARGQSLGYLLRGTGRVLVLLGVRAVAVAVLEVDPVVLDGLALQLGHHARVDALTQLAREAQGLGQGGRVGPVLAERAQGEVAELARRVGLEELGPAVDRVDGLAIGWVAGVLAGEGRVRPAQARQGRLDRPIVHRPPTLSLPT